MLPLLVGACTKKEQAAINDTVYARYSGEDQSIIIEQVNAQWQGGTVAIIADGYEHEQVKLYLTSIAQPGSIDNISSRNISFSDGLDFESTEVVSGGVTILAASNEAVSGEFKVLLLDQNNGLERRWVEGSFKVTNQN